MTQVSSDSSRFTNLRTFFIAASILIVANAFLLLNAFQNIREQQQWVEHTAEVKSELDQLLAAITDAETAVRGYLLTQQAEYLSPYQGSVDDAWLHMRKVKALTYDNPEQQLALADLEKTLAERESVFKSTLRNGVTTTKKDVLPGDGKIVMDRLKSQLADVKAGEQKLLIERQQKASELETIGFASWIFATLVSLGLAGAAFVLIRRSWKHQEEENSKQAKEAWAQTKTAEVASFLAEDLMVAELGDKILGMLCRTMRIPAARMFVLENGELHLRAAYADTPGLPEVKHKRLQLGESLLGEAIKKDEMMKVTDLPKDYINIESAFGGSAPTSILFAPLYQWGKPIGVIEFAQLRPLSDDERSLLNRLRDVIGTGLNTALAKEDMQELLNTTQDQAQELQAQQEELRASNEELEQQARTLEMQQENLNTKNRELEFSRKEVEAKALDLEKTNQYKSEFLAKMSHELRTPLNSLLILATLLKENKEGNLSEQQVHFASTIHDAGNDLLGLISDILDISKIEARKLTLKAEKFTIGCLIEQLQTTFLPQTNKKSLRLVIDATDESKAILMNTDLQRVEQILRNFLANAIKFTEKGTITIKAHQSTIHEGFVSLKVIDTGIGITPEKRGLIFEAFEQADSSISRRYGGTGLGLAISKELTQLLGGFVYIDSEEGQGSAFTLEIPLRLPGALAHHDQHSQTVIRHEINAPVERSNALIDEKVRAIIAELKPQRKTLLIVEDDITCSHMIAEAAHTYDYHPVEVQTGEMALAVLKEFKPTAIMLDIKLPGISGYGLLETIKQTPDLRHIPVHMISAMEFQPSTLRMGAMGYLGKPLSVKDVKEALHHIESLVTKKGRKLLVIEDDENQRQAIVSLVQSLDLKITAVGLGKEALDLLASETFDCVILDLSLPDMSGSEFLNKLSEIGVTVPPVIIYTGQDLSRDEEAALRRYAESIILKGVRSPERLLDEVNLFLHRVEEDLPSNQREILKKLRTREQNFDGRRVLLVDDDLRNLFSLTHVLEDKGFKVTVARDGVEALQKLEEHAHIDVILMDIMMPKMDGYEAIAKIRSQEKHATTPIIALTAKAMKGDHEKCIEVGANDYLPKPINLNSLISVLKVWVQSMENMN